MRIIDYNQPEALSEITLLLDRDEVAQLIGYLVHLLTEPTDHIHLSTEDYRTEITVARFDTPTPEAWHPKTRKYL